MRSLVLVVRVTDEYAQRSRLHSVRGGVVHGACDLDAKIGAAEQTGKPFWTSERDVRGSRAWLDALSVMLGGVKGECYMLRATNSPTGDPFRATAWRDKEETSARARVALRALLQVGPGAVSLAIAAPMGMQSGKRFLPNVGRGAGTPRPELNEIGAWAGSRAQGARVETAPEAASEAAHEMAGLYSREAADEVVPGIMEAHVEMCRALIRRVGLEGLPEVGGWSMFAGLRLAPP